MQEKVMQKMLKVLELAAMLNSGETRRKLTKEKPTVFLYFSGHVGRLKVQIHSMGWDFDEPFCDPNYSWDIYYNNNDSQLTIDQLDEAIKTLKQLIEKWEAKK